MRPGSLWRRHRIPYLAILLVTAGFVFASAPSAAAQTTNGVIAGIVSDAQWHRLCAVLGMEDLAADPRLKHDAGRGAEREMLMRRIGEAVAQRDSSDVVETLVGADVTVAPVNTPMSVLEDRHVSAPGRMLSGRIGKVEGKLPPLPYETDAYSFSVRHHAPAEPGEHTREVLLELGYTIEELESLARKGVVKGAGLPARTPDSKSQGV